MPRDLVLGFLEQPTDLHDLLLSLGFERMTQIPATADPPIPIDVYHHFSSGKSVTGVWLHVHKGVAPARPDEPKPEDLDRKFVASAAVNAPFGASDFDCDTQRTIARILNDRYKSFLLDLETDEILTDKC